MTGPRLASLVSTTEAALMVHAACLSGMANMGLTNIFPFIFATPLVTMTFDCAPPNRPEGPADVKP